MLDTTTPELERAHPLRAPRLVPDDIELAFFCDGGAPVVCDDVDLRAETASECTYAAGDPINLRDPWGLGTNETGVAPAGCEGTSTEYVCTEAPPGGSGFAGMYVRQTGQGGIATPSLQSLGGLTGVRAPPPDPPPEPEVPWIGPGAPDVSEGPWDTDGPGGGNKVETREERGPSWPRIVGKHVGTAAGGAVGGMAVAAGVWGLGRVASGLRAIEATLLGVVPEGEPVFKNRYPSRLANELSLGNRLGVRPVHLNDPEFPGLANAGTLKFAVTPKGELMFVPKWVQGVEISHSVITGGADVVAAGEVDISVAGLDIFVTDVSAHSGHYLPTEGSLDIAKRAFEAYGVTWK